MPTTAVPNYYVGAGYLFWAPLASTVPAMTVTGSKFTDAWPVSWLSLGATEDGSTDKVTTKIEAIEVAELFDPVAWVTTSREASLAMNLADYTAMNLKRSMNGGTIITTGATTTTLTKYTPPNPGAEIRCMLGWESLDNTVRKVWYQCFQGGDISRENKKAPSKTTIPVEYKVEVPASGVPFEEWFAGIARLGV